MGKKRGLLSSITLLAIGGVLVAKEELAARFPDWQRGENEKKIQINKPDRTDKKSVFADPEIQNGLVGVAFALEEKMEHGLQSIDRLTRRSARRTMKILKPVTSSWPGRRFASHIDSLAARGEREIKQFARYGHSQAEESKKVFRTAISSSVDEMIGDLSHNTEIQQLVQTQSASLAEEIVEEIRERTVSADNYLEMIVRNILKRPSRDQLPEPPPQVLEKVAASHRKPHRRVEW